MQLKLYKRSTLLLGITVLAELCGVIALLVYREKWIAHKIPVIVCFVLFLLLINGIFSYYDLNADRNLIRKAVSNGDVALARIKDGSFVRFGRDARLKNHVFWKLNVDVYDNDMKKHEASIIEKFSLHQTSIPKGDVYVTYVEGKEDDCLIIPNIIISSIAEYKPLVDDYEKALRPKYLNAYINDGLMLQTYEDSIKEANRQ
ncbi:MAG: hypothetical protein K5908_05350 [Erysipelotrichaceae bacterium]|nr:hypothetical protein [Erysipelotrichaceae bacterium]